VGPMHRWLLSSWMLIVAGVLLLLALGVVSPFWGALLVACAVVVEVAEKAFWFWRTQRIPLAVGVEAMVGRAVTVVSACQPEGRVRFGRESWQARCSDGAAVGERLVIDAVERVTLIVRRPGARELLLPQATR
jgi:membrane protein implicated in regulation of membrane protease activity